MNYDEQKVNAILGKIGLETRMVWTDPDPRPFDLKVFITYAPYRDAHTKEMDAVHRMSETILIHRPSGLRVGYLESENYYGTESTFRLRSIFIITLQDQRLDVVDVDFSNKVFLTPDGDIPFSAVRKSRA